MKTLKGKGIRHCHLGQKIMVESHNKHTESLGRKAGECDTLENKSFEKLPCMLRSIGLHSGQMQDTCSENANH